MIAFLKSIGFLPLNTNTSILIYYDKDKDNVTIMSLYIDNFLIVAKHQNLMELFKSYFKVEYNVRDLEKVKIIISWQVN